MCCDLCVRACVRVLQEGFLDQRLSMGVPNLSFGPVDCCCTRGKHGCFTVTRCYLINLLHWATKNLVGARINELEALLVTVRNPEFMYPTVPGLRCALCDSR